MAHRGEGWGVQTPPPKFRKPSRIVPKTTRLWKMLKIAEFSTPTHQDVRKKGNKILKLLPVRNCFILAMTNKLLVIIIDLKYQKLRNFYYMKWNFCTKLRLPPEPLTRVLPPPDPRSLCPLSSTEFVEPPSNKIPGYATAQNLPVGFWLFIFWKCVSSLKHWKLTAGNLHRSLLCWRDKVLALRFRFLLVISNS